MLLTGGYQPVDDNQRKQTAGQSAMRPFWTLGRPEFPLKNN
jgi:hypothetical protein